MYLGADNLELIIPKIWKNWISISHWITEVTFSILKAEPSASFASFVILQGLHSYTYTTAISLLKGLKKNSGLNLAQVQLLLTHIQAPTIKIEITGVKVCGTRTSIFTLGQLIFLPFGFFYVCTCLMQLGQQCF